MPLDQANTATALMTDGQLMLLDIAKTLTLSKQSHDWSVSELTQKAGVAKGSFYNHFDTKNELLNRLLSIEIARWLEIAGRKVQEIQEVAQVPEVLFKSAIDQELLILLIAGHRNGLMVLPATTFTPLSTQLGICFGMRQRNAYLAARSVIAALTATIALVPMERQYCIDEALAIFSHLTKSFLRPA